jgi:hypothetical protein
MIVAKVGSKEKTCTAKGCGLRWNDASHIMIMRLEKALKFLSRTIDRSRGRPMLSLMIEVRGKEDRTRKRSPRSEGRARRVDGIGLLHRTTCCAAAINKDGTP